MPYTQTHIVQDNERASRAIDPETGALANTVSGWRALGVALPPCLGLWSCVAERGQGGWCVCVCVGGVYIAKCSHMAYRHSPSKLRL